ncbi:hypothetical protein CDAR_250812 [Caerostris darwini]|uniref:tRNA (uracil(54)-C(5))-methyltransferase n=1 Tax=Caerostris darwini TaxID=1538125 RepID=A0AAV4TMY5_9ARAC|nr:hypothetical protein CDAR_250812 [Caerostris darwini]
MPQIFIFVEEVCVPSDNLKTCFLILNELKEMEAMEIQQEHSVNLKESTDIKVKECIKLEITEENDLKSCNNVNIKSKLDDSNTKVQEIKNRKETDLNDIESVNDSNVIKEEKITNEETDLYSYTKLNDFTSEIYKIELGNLPNIVGYKQLRKLLNSTLNLNTRKVKAIGNPPHFAFITFKDEKDRDKALDTLSGYQWKGKTLTAKKASPAADPMVKKRKAGESEDCSDPKKANTDEPIELRLKNAVTPFWNVPYEEQLKRKEDDIHKYLMRLSKSIEKVNPSAISLLSKNRKANFHQCCPLLPIKKSPVTTAYRNKCEFTVGRHLYTKEKTVGFRLNSYKEGSMSVAEPDDCINISEAMLKAVKNELEEEKTKLKKYYEEGPGSSCGITSVYFQLFSKKAKHEETANLTHLMGKKFIEETLLSMKFQVSPEAFFQINVPATEILYSMVADLVTATSSATVLDVCCGTGTISLCLAKSGAKVIGIEMCPEAVENAKLNAENNKLPDVEFICGKAEDVIYTALSKCDTSEIIAVVDPPRAGLRKILFKFLPV